MSRFSYSPPPPGAFPGRQQDPLTTFSQGKSAEPTLGDQELIGIGFNSVPFVLRQAECIPVFPQYLVLRQGCVGTAVVQANRWLEGNFDQDRRQVLLTGNFLVCDLGTTSSKQAPLFQFSNCAQPTLCFVSPFFWFIIHHRSCLAQFLSCASWVEAVLSCVKLTSSFTAVQ